MGDGGRVKKELGTLLSDEPELSEMPRLCSAFHPGLGAETEPPIVHGYQSLPIPSLPRQEYLTWSSSRTSVWTDQGNWRWSRRWTAWCFDGLWTSREYGRARPTRDRGLSPKIARWRPRIVRAALGWSWSHIRWSVSKQELSWDRYHRQEVWRRVTYQRFFFFFFKGLEVPRKINVLVVIHWMYSLVQVWAIDWIV